MPLSEHNSGAGEGDRRSAGSPESSLVGSLPALFADLRRLDSQNERCISPGLSPAGSPAAPLPAVFARSPGGAPPPAV